MHSKLRLRTGAGVSFVFTIAVLIQSVTNAVAAALALYVVDPGNNRILKFSPPFTNGMSASAVIGQTDFTSSNPGLGPDVLDVPLMIDHDATGNPFVVDYENNRVLEFAQPITTGESASLVIGQPDFTTDNVGFAINQTHTPQSVAIDRRGMGARCSSRSKHTSANSCLRSRME
jgi:hypothetical protein